MVEVGQCFVTKFGSIHTTKEEAAERECTEECCDFARKFANVLSENNTSSRWHEAYALGTNVYTFRNEIIKAISDYDFIEPEPEWITGFKSSNIAGFGYNPKEKILTIEFKSGDTYDYYDVSAFVFDEMKKVISIGDSIGGYFHANINKVFRYDKRQV